MNRPIKPNLNSMRSGKMLTIELYIGNLEKYCNELEKALDKACNILNQDLYCHDCRYKYSNPSVCDNCGDGQIGEEKWKEWLMKEEEK